MLLPPRWPWKVPVRVTNPEKGAILWLSKSQNLSIVSTQNLERDQSIHPQALKTTFGSPLRKGMRIALTLASLMAAPFGGKIVEVLFLLTRLGQVNGAGVGGAQRSVRIESKGPEYPIRMTFPTLVLAWALCSEVQPPAKVMMWMINTLGLLCTATVVFPCSKPIQILPPVPLVTAWTELARVFQRIIQL